ncbi:MAG: SPFH/Band 7/PHB domain protein [Succinivibrionaceae bacterium]|nr:SPFH/Band 7/PHB domain protein [Succinivibrionaceae bacterium]
MGFFSVFLLVLLVLAVIFVMKSICVVGQGYNYVVERLGRYKETLNPGLNIIIPFVDRIYKKVDMKEMVMDIPPQDVFTHDNVNAKIDAICFIQVHNATKAVYEVENYYNAIRQLVNTQLRSVLGSMELDQMLSQRDTINKNLLIVVDKATEAWGVKVTRIDIRDINVSSDVMESMSAQLKAERNKRATILESEGVRQAQILRAEGEKSAKVLEAEAEKESAFLAAEARERAAQAEATATKLVSDAINAGNTQAVNYFVAQKYTEALKSIGSSENSKVVMIPLEASSIIGSISGISSLVKDLNKNNAEQ